jgi:hypothetical protein
MILLLLLPCLCMFDVVQQQHGAAVIDISSTTNSKAVAGIASCLLVHSAMLLASCVSS